MISAWRAVSPYFFMMEDCFRSMRLCACPRLYVNPIWSLFFRSSGCKWICFFMDTTCLCLYKTHIRFIKKIKRYTSGNHNKVQLTAQLLRLPGGSLNCKGNHGVIAGILSGFCYNPSVPAVDFPDQDPFSYMDAEQDMAVCINALYGKMIA